MKLAQDNLAIVQIERSLKPTRALYRAVHVRTGWIRYIRQALGMTLSVLAERTNLSVGTVAKTEQREFSGKVTLEHLQKMAQALECEFFYGFVPKDNIQTLLKHQAFEKAQLILEKADTHMTLEDQKVKQDSDERLERVANKLLEKGDVW